MDNPPDEQGFLDALKKAPRSLRLHLAYGDWLAEHKCKSRSDALRAWVAFLKAPISAASMSTVVNAYQAYQDSLLQKDAQWIGQMEKIRRWIRSAGGEDRPHLYR